MLSTEFRDKKRKENKRAHAFCLVRVPHFFFFFCFKCLQYALYLHGEHIHHLIGVIVMQKWRKGKAWKCTSSTSLKKMVVGCFVTADNKGVDFFFIGGKRESTDWSAPSLIETRYTRREQLALMDLSLSLSLFLSSCLYMFEWMKRRGEEATQRERAKCYFSFFFLRYKFLLKQQQQRPLPPPPLCNSRKTREHQLTLTRIRNSKRAKKKKNL